VVVRDVAARALMVGNPARQLREVRDEELLD
jgi:acetyltransferase-like isoleucine patch superfamily enzyme